VFQSGHIVWGKEEDGGGTGIKSQLGCVLSARPDMGEHAARRTPRRTQDGVRVLLRHVGATEDAAAGISATSRQACGARRNPRMVAYSFKPLR
jgi:hypothetical protein